MALTAKDLAGPDPKPMSKVEVDVLKELVSKLPPDPTIIQIGAERGVSTLAMLEARPDAFIFSIDMGPRPEERANLIKAGLEWQRVVRGLGKSQDIGKFWPRHWTCDLLFIDGDHRRPGIDLDIQFWAGFVEGGGLIVFHDYIPNPPPRIKGRVASAVDELCEGWNEVMYVDRIKAFRV